MERTTYIHAKIQEAPLGSGRKIRDIKLHSGKPSLKDYQFAKKNGYIITALEDTCLGVRIYVGSGCWR